MKIHYRQNTPVGNAACGQQRSPSLLTTDPNKVTCKNCIKSMKSQKTIDHIKVSKKVNLAVDIDDENYMTVVETDEAVIVTLCISNYDYITEEEFTKDEVKKMAQLVNKVAHEMNNE